MKRDAIARAALKREQVQADIMGTEISINDGEPFFAYVDFPNQKEDFASGGFSLVTNITVRFPIGRAAKPVHGSKIVLVNENISFRSETAMSNTGDPNTPMVLFTAIRK